MGNMIFYQKILSTFNMFEIGLTLILRQITVFLDYYIAMNGNWCSFYFWFIKCILKVFLYTFY